jgi:hypothetical protein
MLKANIVSHLQSLGMHEIYQFRITGVSYLECFKINKTNTSLHLAAVKSVYGVSTTGSTSLWIDVNLLASEFYI